MQREQIPAVRQIPDPAHSIQTIGERQGPIHYRVRRATSGNGIAAAIGIDAVNPIRAPIRHYDGVGGIEDEVSQVIKTFVVEAAQATAGAPLLDIGSIAIISQSFVVAHPKSSTAADPM